jgi:tetratricopeptide (TPR) repeat protein
MDITTNSKSAFFGIIALCFFGILYSLSFSIQMIDPQTAADWENEANSCFLSSDYEKAASFYKNALHLNKTDGNTDLSTFIKSRLILCYSATSSSLQLSAGFQQKAKEIVVNESYWLCHLLDGQIFQLSGLHLEALELFNLASEFVQIDMFTSKIAALYMICISICTNSDAKLNNSSASK